MMSKECVNDIKVQKGRFFTFFKFLSGNIRSDSSEFKMF